jgi:hypothetical protein
MTLTNKINWLFKSLFVVSLLYALWSYSLTDPNLILTSSPPYWQFQQWMWQTFFHNRQLLTDSFLLLIAGFFGIYSIGWQVLRQAKQLETKKLLIGALIALSPLFFSYNALSHDIFNYIFNAKMVLVYQANPHVQIALDYARDDWTRFMHNTHTPAPYGYGWTALSLIPYALGFSKFLPTWLIFRAFSVLSLALLYFLLQKISRAINRQALPPTTFWLVFLNPLLILEVVANQHNDLWMMVPALAAVALVFSKPKKQLLPILGLSVLLLAASVTIKFATIALIPIWLLCVLRWAIKPIRVAINWQRVALWSSILLFIPLLTARSQQFLPWYLLWSLVWLPFIENKWWRSWLIIFSITALLRYAPWLWAGEFTPEVLTQQKWLLWGGSTLGWLIWQIKQQLRYNHQ